MFVATNDQANDLPKKGMSKKGTRNTTNLKNVNPKPWPMKIPEVKQKQHDLWIPNKEQQKV